DSKRDRAKGRNILLSEWRLRPAGAMRGRPRRLSVRRDDRGRAEQPAERPAGAAPHTRRIRSGALRQEHEWVRAGAGTLATSAAAARPAIRRSGGRIGWQYRRWVGRSRSKGAMKRGQSGEEQSGFARRAAWLTAANIIAFGLSFLAPLLLARTLSQTEF